MKWSGAKQYFGLPFCRCAWKELDGEHGSKWLVAFHFKRAKPNKAKTKKKIKLLSFLTIAFRFSPLWTWIALGQDAAEGPEEHTSSPPNVPSSNLLHHFSCPWQGPFRCSGYGLLFIIQLKKRYAGYNYVLNTRWLIPEIAPPLRNSPLWESISLNPNSVISGRSDDNTKRPRPK